ncbi:MAG: DUF5666 domain-containing protein [Alphaproteobacteria bacterium]|nr:DUF5666 domain-containing protein [Alphaproteobacteria bacterium]
MTAPWFDRRRVLMGLAGVSLVGCETGTQSLAVTDNREGGIGGTGIVGTVTGFGSLKINGMTVELPTTTAVEDGYGPVESSALHVGDTLTIEAETRADGALVAKRVVRERPLIGPITSLNGGLEVMGAPVASNAALPEGLRLGDRVAVSGLWRRERVQATRLAVAPQPQDIVSGAVAGDRIGVAPIAEPAALASLQGQYVTARGRYAEGVFVVESLRPGRFVGAAGALARLSVEGYLEPIADAPRFTVSGLGHSFEKTARLQPVAAARTLFVGPYTGLFDVRFGLPLPETAEDRRRLLEAVEDPFAPQNAIDLKG